MGFASSIDFSVSKGSVLENMSMLDAMLDDNEVHKTASITNEQIREGDVLIETYEVTSDAHSGGMGSVWKVQHTKWDMQLAMKRPKPLYFAEASDKTKANFIAECENWINLGLHPNIVSCYYIREIGGVPSVFSEWMDGGSLADVIASGVLYEGSDDDVLERILDIAIQIERGLGYSHKNNLVHQDVKPGNVLLTSDWNAKVSDFGLAKAISRVAGESAATTSGRTLAYCPREQTSGAEAEPWMDVYAWAATVLEMLSKGCTWVKGSDVADDFSAYFAKTCYDVPETLELLLKTCVEEHNGDFESVDQEMLQAYAEATGQNYLREKPEAAIDTAESLNNRAMSFLDLGKTEEAITLLEMAADANPNCMEAAFNQGVLRWREGLADDEYLRDRVGAVTVGQDEELRNEKFRLLDQIKEMRGINFDVAMQYDYKGSDPYLDGGAVIANDHPVHDFMLLDENRVVLKSAVSVSRDDDTWFHYAIGEKPDADTVDVYWDLAENTEIEDDDMKLMDLSYDVLDERYEDNDFGDFDERPPLEAPKDVVERAQARGWLLNKPTCSALSSDGKLLLLGFYTKIVLVEAETGRCLRTFSFKSNWPTRRVEFSPDEKRIYACASRDGVVSTWGLFIWDVPTIDWAFQPRICRAQSFKLRADFQANFNAALARFDECMPEGRYKEASEALYEAEEISGFENDPELLKRFKTLAEEAVPIGVLDYWHITEVRRVWKNAGGDTYLSRDGKYAMFNNGRVFNLFENHQIIEDPDYPDPIAFTRDGKSCILREGGMFRREFITVDLESGKIVKKCEEEDLDDYYWTWPKKYEKTREPSVMLPDGILAAVAESYLMDESCGADFINTRTEEKIGEVIVFRDFEMDLMPKLVLFSDDARYMLYILQANANTIAEYTKIRWKYPEHRIDYPEKTPEPAPRPAASQPTPAPEPVPSATERRASELRAEMQALQSELAVMEKELYSLKGLFTIGKRAKLAAKMSPKVIRVKEIQEELNEIE